LFFVGLADAAWEKRANGADWSGVQYRVLPVARRTPVTQFTEGTHMSVRRLAVGAVPVLVISLLLAPTGTGGPQPGGTPAPGRAPNKPPAGALVEVRYTDDSNMKLRLLDEKLEMTTRYGVLRIAPEDIRRIEFASRVPADVAEKVALAISKLNHADFKVREAATEELKEYRERAYPQVLKALKSEDPEVARRADEIAVFIRAKVPAALLEVREHDVVYTDDSKNTGRLTAEYLRVGTYQFGELRLKLHDIHSLRAAGSASAEDQIAGLPGPANLIDYQNQAGKVLTFTVTGAAAGSLYGTDVYTLDSSLAAAVVHAGLAKPRETVTVKVRIIATVPQFAATTRNGISSFGYGQYPGFEFVRR
jgi:hypothetical protein